MASIIQHLLGLGFLGGFEDLENVSEMVAETSERSTKQKCYRWKQHVHVHVCSEKCCQWKQHVHVQNLQFDQRRKSDFSALKMSCYVIKAMDNV